VILVNFQAHLNNSNRTVVIKLMSLKSKLSIGMEKIQQKSRSLPSLTQPAAAAGRRRRRLATSGICDARTRVRMNSIV
jgi:hypothetical protein